MKYKVSPSDQQKLEHFARSNFAELIGRILLERHEQLNTYFRAIEPDMFRQVQGRALEIDDILTILKIKGTE